MEKPLDAFEKRDLPQANVVGLREQSLLHFSEFKREEEPLQEIETIWRSALEAVGDSIWEWNIQTNQAFFSRQWWEMLGCSEAEFSNSFHEWEDRIHPDDLARTKVEIARHLRGETHSYLCEHRLRHRDGSYKWILGRGKVTSHDASGKPLRLIGTHSDITQLKMPEQTPEAPTGLLEIGERYKALFERSLDGVFLHDLEGRFIDANQAALDMLGYSKEEIPLLHFSNILSTPEELPKAFAAVEELLKPGSQGGLTEYRLQRKHGEYIWAETLGCLVYREGKPFAIQWVVRDITARKQAEDARRESEEKYRSLFERSLDVVFMSTPDGQLLNMNPAGAELFGYASKEEMLEIGMKSLFVEACDWTKRLEVLERAGHVKDYALRLKRKDGAILTVLETCTAMRNENGRISVLHGIMRDVTEKRKLEQQLIQAQKMESIGRMAGGVAHDFNNLLTAIIGYSELLMLDLQPEHPLWSRVGEIKKIGEKASALTQHLLAFSRSQVMQPKVFDLNMLITDEAKILRRLIGEDIELVTALDPALHRVKADPGQFAQVIMNLAVNARDAMPQGGKLTLETANVHLVEDDAWSDASVLPGQYVMLAVSDNGIGMDDEIQSHIFEPFFTTKEMGKGTGLGLSTVYGIVRQSGGHIRVYSESGQGTILKIYMPVSEDLETRELAQVKEVGTYRGTETILVAEDDDMVRSLACMTLRRNGYHVLEAANAGEALMICQQEEGRIHLMLTDVIMPRINGRELARQVASTRPSTKVLYMSGYTDDAIMQHDLADPGLEFIQKPFSTDELAYRIREVLDSP